MLFHLIRYYLVKKYFVMKWNDENGIIYIYNSTRMKERDCHVAWK